MRGIFSITLFLLVVVMVTTDADKGHKGHKGKHGNGKESRVGGECTDWTYGKCVPEAGDCGNGVREANCKDQTQKIDCKIPCNWKKDISDCKYRFTSWGECDAELGTKSRSGTLKKALFNAQCEPTVKVSKPCSAKPKRSRGEKKRNGN